MSRTMKQDLADGVPGHPACADEERASQWRNKPTSAERYVAERLPGCRLVDDYFCKGGVRIEDGLQPHMPSIPVVDTSDPVTRPSHYTRGGVECIDAIRAALTEEEFRGYCKGNTIKYIWRERHKGGVESLRKADYYLTEIIP